jgi:hypothetical protein
MLFADPSAATNPYIDETANLNSIVAHFESYVGAIANLTLFITFQRVPNNILGKFSSPKHTLVVLDNHRFILFRLFLNR